MYGDKKKGKDFFNHMGAFQNRKKVISYGNFDLAV
jgi:hypothetical protein